MNEGHITDLIWIGFFTLILVYLYLRARLRKKKADDSERKG